MNLQIQAPTRKTIVYPESDGKPMADNTRQWEWIATIKEGLDGVFRNDQEVFIASDLFWYPVEGQPTIVTAPDVLVAFGRPKGHRGSYLQWLEGNVSPQVVFEILSPGNRFRAMMRKFRFYDRYGVDEYYIYDPDANELDGYRREGGSLQEIPEMAGWVSPRLKVRFEPGPEKLTLYDPEGNRFLTYLELLDERDKAQRQAAEQARRADEQAQRAQELEQRADELAAQLRALGIEPKR